jgi:hypothetical protein
LVGGDAMLLPLGGYGGSTPPMPPWSSSSPALNAADPTFAPGADQRGFGRAGLPDIGAAEAGWTTTHPGGPLVVNSNDDVVSSPTEMTLRRAVVLANAHPGADTVSFDPAVFGTVPRTIRLLSGELNFADPGGPTTVAGPGAALLTVDGNQFRNFYQGPDVELPPLVEGERSGRAVELYSSGSAVVISGLTIANCYVTSRDGNWVMESLGGAARVIRGSLALIDVAVTNSYVGDTQGAGGGLFNSGMLSLTNTTLVGNVVGAGGSVGGAVYNVGTLTITNSTLTANGSFQGGALYNDGTATLTNVTVSGNSPTSPAEL